MATYHHFEMAEHEERSVSRRIAAGEKYTEATGSRETVKYTGPWADMLARMESQTGGGGVEVSCDLERLGGGIGELRITRETYRIPSSDQGEEGEPDSGAGDEAGPGSEDNPVYTSSSTLVPCCILTHPKFKDIGEKELRALKAMLDGQDENSLLSDDDSNATGGKRIKDLITSDAGKKAMSYIRKGVTQWPEVHTQVTARWKGRSNKYTMRSIVAAAPGGISTPQGCDWRVDGVGSEEQGGVTWQSVTLTLSGDGGWDKYLYSK
jgi:hypothetical protein